MRPRIRSIKPEAALDEELWDLGNRTGLPVFQAFTMLWCYADREGRFEWRPRALRPLLLPYWDGDMGALLDAMAEAGFVVRYEVEGRAYGFVKNFHKHQAPNKREPASVLPAPAGADTCTHVHDNAEEGSNDEPDRSEVEASETFDENETTGTRIVPHVHARAPRASRSRSLPHSSSHQGGAGGPPAHVRNFEASFGQPHPDDEQAFARWATRFAKTGARFDAKRASCLEDRRLEGMTLDDVDQALEGAAVDEWLRGNGFKLSLIFANRERFEECRDRGREIRAGTYRAPTKSGPQPTLKQPNSGYRSERTKHL